MDTAEFLQSLSEEQKAAFAVVRDELKAMYSDVEATLKTAHDSIAVDLQKTIDEQSKFISAANDAINAGLTEIATLKDERDDLTGQVRTLTESLVSTEKLLDAAKDDAAKMTQNMIAAIANLSELESKVKTLEATIDANQKKINRLTNEKAAMKAHPDVIEAEKTEAKKIAREQIRKAKALQAEAEAKLAELEPPE